MTDHLPTIAVAVIVALRSTPHLKARWSRWHAERTPVVRLCAHVGATVCQTPADPDSWYCSAHRKDLR